MVATAAEIFPLVDATKQDCITDEQAQFFRDNGLIIIRNVLRGAELKAMQDETLPFVQRAMRERVKDPDYACKKHEMQQTQPACRNSPNWRDALCRVSRFAGRSRRSVTLQLALRQSSESKWGMSGPHDL